jgi:hypothetical protein
VFDTVAAVAAVAACRRKNCTVSRRHGPNVSQDCRWSPTHAEIFFEIRGDAYLEANVAVADEANVPLVDEANITLVDEANIALVEREDAIPQYQQ